LQKTQKLIEADKVDFIVGLYLVERVAGLAQAGGGFPNIPDQRKCRDLAGRRRDVLALLLLDHPGQNDQTPQAIGEYMNQKGVKTAFLIGPDLRGRQGHAQRVRKAFQGPDRRRGVHEMAPTSSISRLNCPAPAPRSRARSSYSYPGVAGVQVSSSSQYTQGGFNGQIPLYSAFTIDETTLPQQKDLALGVPGAQEWVNDLPNAANRKFVADFRARYKHGPVILWRAIYDAANLINSAVTAVKGDLTKKDAMREEMSKAAFASVRGAFRFGNDHFPIQNFLSAGGG